MRNSLRWLLFVCGEKSILSSDFVKESQRQFIVGIAQVCYCLCVARTYGLNWKCCFSARLRLEKQAESVGMPETRPLSSPLSA